MENLYEYKTRLQNPSFSLIELSQTDQEVTLSQTDSQQDSFEKTSPKRYILDTCYPYLIVTQFFSDILAAV